MFSKPIGKYTQRVPKIEARGNKITYIWSGAKYARTTLYAFVIRIRTRMRRGLFIYQFIYEISLRLRCESFRRFREAPLHLVEIANWRKYRGEGEYYGLSFTFCVIITLLIVNIF